MKERRKPEYPEKTPVFLSVATRRIVCAYLSLRYTDMLLGHTDMLLGYTRDTLTCCWDTLGTH